MMAQKDKILVLIPTRGRVEKLTRCINSIPNSPTIHVAVGIDNDPETHQKIANLDNPRISVHSFVRADLQPFGSVHIRNCLARVYHQLSYHLLYAIDDIEFDAGAIEAALETLNNKWPDSDGVVGFKQRPMSSYCPAGIGLMGRNFWSRYPAGEFLYPGYYHFATQEISRLANKFDRLATCEAASLYHYHPATTKTKADSTHRDARKNHNADAELSESRRKAGILWGENTCSNSSNMWDFEDCLVRWLSNCSPAQVVEWGPGKSTAIIHEYAPDADIISIEHDKAYHQKAVEEHGDYADIKHIAISQSGPTSYACFPLSGGMRADLVFIDGRRRVECLQTARKILRPGGVAILHDANRPEYSHAYEDFQVEDLSEDGGTRVLRPHEYRGAISLAAEDTSPTKVFGIGLSKTGTSSLQKALEVIGYPGVHNPPCDTVLQLAEERKSLTDAAVIPYYRTLRWKYPDAKFVLTTRDTEDWLDSCRAHWSRVQPSESDVKTRQNRIAIYGREDFNADDFRRIKEAHEKTVKTLFNSEPHRLLVMDITKEDEWEKLCSFLGVPIPDKEFPRENRRDKKERIGTDIAPLHKCARQNKPFCVIRCRDGEATIINNFGEQRDTGDGCGTWQFDPRLDVDVKFREELIEALEYDGGEHYFVASHDKESGHFKDSKKMIDSSRIRGTFLEAPIFAHDNWPDQTEKLWGLISERLPVVMVCHENANPERVSAQVEKVYRVEDSAWRNRAVERQLIADLSKAAHTAVFIAAGPYAPVLAYKAWKNTGKKHTIIDVGSSMDVQLWGKGTRVYH